MKKRAFYSIILIISLVSFSCKDYLTIEPEGYIPRDQTFQTSDDAISAVYGLYALMQPCVDVLFLAGDVQSDLAVAARGADSWIAEIAQNRVTPQNPYTDYSVFYKLVCACNNAIEGLNEIQRLDPVNYTLERFNYNVGEITCIRSWAYLQMVKIWGDVPYVENSVTNTDDIGDIAPSPGNVILEKIEKEMTELAFPAMKSALRPSAMGFKIFYSQFNNLTVSVLLSEINLNLGKYQVAYDWMRPFAPYGYNQQDSYWSQYYPAANVPYTRQFGYDIYEWYMNAGQYILFDGSKGQKNNLMRWTNNKDGGIYAVKPSSVAIKRWATTGNIGPDPVRYDYEGWPIVKSIGDRRGWGVNYYISGEDTIIFRYLFKHVTGNFGAVWKEPRQNDIETNDDAAFILWRAAQGYLMVCEMWNNLGMTEMALVPMNGAQGPSYSLRGIRNVSLSEYRRFDPAGGSHYQQMEQFIVDELALELAYEGHRWFDLVRFSKRTPDMLAKTVAAKYPAGQQDAIKAKLMNPNYWYWPYYYKNVTANKLLDQKPGY